MNTNFLTPDYLQSGTPKQKEAFQTLQKINLFSYLSHYDPILVGTIPISVDIDSSDLDIICEVYDQDQFETILHTHFSQYKGFHITRVDDHIMTANFFIDGFEIELYGQDEKTTQQNGYRHMIIEDRILRLGGDTLREQIIPLKQSALKTEPTFAKLLNLKGDPYEALLLI